MVSDLDDCVVAAIGQGYTAECTLLREPVMYGAGQRVPWDGSRLGRGSVMRWQGAAWDLRRLRLDSLVIPCASPSTLENPVNPLSITLPVPLL